MSYPETLSELTNYPKALSHAESGGGGNLKSLVIKNETGDDNLEIYNYINEAGKFVSPVDGYGTKIPSGEEITVYYAEPVEGGEWEIFCNSISNIEPITMEGITFDSEINISHNAPDGAEITLTAHDDDAPLG